MPRPPAHAPPAPTGGVVAVVGASGGLGASSLAVAVALRRSGGPAASVVVDLDLPSGGLDVTAGIEHLAGRRWSDLADLRGAVPAGPFLAALPNERGCHVLSAGGPRRDEVPDGAVRDVLAALAASGTPVVLDLPRGSPHLTVGLRHADLVVVVSGLWTRALADADACVERVVEVVDPSGGTDLRLVTRGPRPGAAVLDDVEAHLGIAHLHHVVDDPAVARAGERGLWPGAGHDALRRCADAVVASAGARTVERAS